MSYWSQGKWWDHDKSETTKKGKRCDHCVTKPRLIPSGQGDPKSLKCPICKGLFDDKGTRFDALALEALRKKQLKQLDDDEEESWESIWGATAPFMRIAYYTGPGRIQ